MKDLARYRAMEALCRQSAVFHPLESWRLLAQAEMWHHKAEDEIAARSLARDAVTPMGVVAQRASLPRAGEEGRSAATD
jgi:hypothetical protein